MCVERLFSRVSLSLFVSPWFRKRCRAYAVLRVELLWILFNGFDVGVRGVALWRYVLLRLTTISFYGCLLSFASVWWGLQRPAYACKAKGEASTAMTTRAVTTTKTGHHNYSFSFLF